eukprot:TRINITY_DN27754_c0_g1_i1.p1 TRINITY_DN27754_c0_g1~~TRINITY_DN27754_c0_g1_i1.p1  ORF type:complete len:1066 (-),score=117.73 TRINITY_DN27754_c0_g1_i1:14-3211(-)
MQTREKAKKATPIGAQQRPSVLHFVSPSAILALALDSSVTPGTLGLLQSRTIPQTRPPRPSRYISRKSTFSDAATHSPSLAGPGWRRLSGFNPFADVLQDEEDADEEQYSESASPTSPSKGSPTYSSFTFGSERPSLAALDSRTPSLAHSKTGSIVATPPPQAVVESEPETPLVQRAVVRTEYDPDVVVPPLNFGFMGIFRPQTHSERRALVKMNRQVAAEQVHNRHRAQVEHHKERARSHENRTGTNPPPGHTRRGGRKRDPYELRELYLKQVEQRELVDEFERKRHMLACFSFPHESAGPGAARSTDLGDRAYHTAVSFQKEIFVFGGISKVYQVQYLPDFLKFSNGKWQPLPSVNPPRGREGHTAVVTEEGEMIIFGGMSDAGLMHDAHSVDLNLDPLVWHKLRVANPPSPRTGHSAVLHANRWLVVFGGRSVRNLLNDCWVLDLRAAPNPLFWVEVQILHPPVHRCRHSTVLHGDFMYVYGGSTELGWPLECDALTVPDVDPAVSSTVSSSYIGERRSRSPTPSPGPDQRPKSLRSPSPTARSITSSAIAEVERLQQRWRELDDLCSLDLSAVVTAAATLSEAAVTPEPRKTAVPVKLEPVEAWHSVQRHGEIHPGRRHSGTLIASHNRLFLYGGSRTPLHGSVTETLDDVHCFDLSKRTWRVFYASPLGRRWGHAAASYKHDGSPAMLIFGGISAPLSNYHFVKRPVRNTSLMERVVGCHLASVEEDTGLAATGWEGSERSLARETEVERRRLAESLAGSRSTRLLSRGFWSSRDRPTHHDEDASARKDPLLQRYLLPGADPRKKEELEQTKGSTCPAGNNFTIHVDRHFALGCFDTQGLLNATEAEETVAMLEEVREGLAVRHGRRSLPAANPQIEADLLNPPNAEDEKSTPMKRGGVQFQRQCAACNERPPVMYFVPCGHTVACEACASEYVDKPCPSCHRFVQEVREGFASTYGFLRKMQLAVTPEPQPDPSPSQIKLLATPPAQFKPIDLVPINQPTSSELALCGKRLTDSPSGVGQSPERGPTQSDMFPKEESPMLHRLRMRWNAEKQRKSLWLK